MACSTVSTRIASHKLRCFLLLFAFTTQLLHADIDLFSLNHDDQGGIKINVLYRTIHDEESLKKKAEETEFHQRSLEQYPQEIKHIEAEKKRIEYNIELKKTILQKKFMESNVK